MTNLKKPIILWRSESNLLTDDAGVTILSSTGPPKDYFQPGPYHDEDGFDMAQNRRPGSDSLPRIPPLSYFCVKSLVKTPELVYQYGFPRPYRPPISPSDPDILQALIPSGRPGHFNLTTVDPRLWAIILQIYSDLPHGLRTYRMALSDKYIPLLQRVPATEHFSLLTVLELPRCSHLNDDTIVHLKILHTLCVLDVSRTTLSAQGIRRLSGTLIIVEDGIDCTNPRRGPWQLRILSLYNCRRVTDATYQYLESFTLLTAVGKRYTNRELLDLILFLDLRGTSCTWHREKIPSSFFPAPAVEKRLYHPTSPLKALSLLLNSEGLFPSSNTGVLHIDHLTHASREHNRGLGRSPDIESFLLAEDSNTVLPASHKVDSSPCPPDWASSFQEPPNQHPENEPPQGPSMDKSEPTTTTLRTMHTVVGEYAAQYKTDMYHSVHIGSSMAHSPGHLPQWGQELLMLYREPPPWAQAQLPPVVKAASRPQKLNELISVDRTNERATKGVQEMRDMLSNRYRSTKKEADSPCDDGKASRRSTSRNPFAVPFGKSNTDHGNVAEKASAQQFTDNPATKSVIAAPHKPPRPLKPISRVAVPIPPGSSSSLVLNDAQHAKPAPRGPWRFHDSSRDWRLVSLPVDEPRGQKADVSLACTVGRSGGEAEPAAARKRPKAVVCAGGSKRQKHE